jgi:PleD family two-component response regulator
VNEHDGRISVRNAPTGGAIFTVELPLSAGKPEEEASEAEAPSDLLFGKKVLIVDDERHIRRFLQQALGISRCQVQVASNRQEALKMTRTNSFDLIRLSRTTTSSPWRLILFPSMPWAW